MSTATVTQSMSALDNANATRLAMSEIRFELIAGSIALAEALEDPRAASHKVFRLLTSINRVGPHRARRIMFRAGVPELKRVRDLTPRQRQALVLELAEGTARS